MITPNESHSRLGKVFGVKDLVLKREDLHPYGSHKGRTIPEMIRRYTEDGHRRFAVSSSGNAALAAGLFVEEYNRTASHPLELEILVGENINRHKEEVLRESFKNESITITKVARPLQELFKITESGEVIGLRQSTDDLALDGYRSLAEELSAIPKLGAVFVATSSGTTAQALADIFLEVVNPPQVHIVQTSAVHPMASEFDKDFEKEERSIAGAIVDSVAHRKGKVVESVQKTGGRGWVVGNKEVEETMEMVGNETALELTPNGALSVAGLRKALRSSWRPPLGRQTVACIICGR